MYCMFITSNLKLHACFLHCSAKLLPSSGYCLHAYREKVVSVNPHLMSLPAGNSVNDDNQGEDVDKDDIARKEVCKASNGLFHLPQKSRVLGLCENTSMLL